MVMIIIPTWVNAFAARKSDHRLAPDLWESPAGLNWCIEYGIRRISTRSICKLTGQSQSNQSPAGWCLPEIGNAQESFSQSYVCSAASLGLLKGAVLISPSPTWMKALWPQGKVTGAQRSSAFPISRMVLMGAIFNGFCSVTSGVA